MSDSDQERQWEMLDERMAKYLLRYYPLTYTDAARLVVELLESCEPPTVVEGTDVLNHCRQVIHMGIGAYVLSQQTVTFREATRALMQYKNSVRERTINEIRQICNRIIGMHPEWRDMKMRQISVELCQRTIEHTFHTTPMQRKARRILHSVFAHAVLNGWCSSNPLDLVVLPPYVEKPIQALSIREVMALLERAKEQEHRPCAAALGLMLWAGIRPNEVVRLHFRDIDFEDRVINVPASHSKTGGSRQITMYAPLYHWLRRCCTTFTPDTPIVPRGWPKRWVNLRQAAGFDNWVPDILRHTFASYHLKHFRNINELLMDMGHATPQQLRTRYLAMENVTKRTAKIFWEYGVPFSPKMSNPSEGGRERSLPLN